MTDYKTVNPATGETLREFETIDAQGVEQALARAHSGFLAWREVPATDRAAVLAAVAKLYDERSDELAAMISLEMGKPVREAKGEVALSAMIYAYYAENGPRLLEDEVLDVPGADESVVRKLPVGALVGVMPWNFPYYQVARFAAPNLMLGNSVLLKHAPNCPQSALLMEEIFSSAGLPADAYVNVFASNDQVADLIADPRVQGVSLTGSERAGAAVAEVAGRNLKKVVLELGGSDPFIVLGTDDLDAVVEAAVGGRLENAGQACNAAKRFIVVDELYEPFLEKFTAALTEVEPGDPTSADTTMGPLSSTAAADRLEDQVKRATAQGAELVAGGGRNGNFFSTTVLTGITPDNDAYREEFFGPVASVYKVGSEDEAVTLANDTDYGLGSYVFTNDPAQALRVADRIEAGMVFVNVVGADGVELPFGGVKSSGFGRELGRFGADEFVNKKLIRVG
jgi:succinate-semialdehyde dehydrogenase/glutarate-semialdehyde dehydrogenase